MNSTSGEHSIESQNNFVLLTGNNGSGKSTLSEALHEVTDYPVVHLDEVLFSRKTGSVNGRGSSKEQFHADVAVVLSDMNDAFHEAGGIIVDGNFLSLRDLTWDRATHIAFLDPPLRLLASRIIRRAIMPPTSDHGNIGYSFHELIPGQKNPLYVARKFNRQKRPKVLQELEKQRKRGAIVIKAASIEAEDIFATL